MKSMLLTLALAAATSFISAEETIEAAETSTEAITKKAVAQEEISTADIPAEEAVQA